MRNSNLESIGSIKAVLTIFADIEKPVSHIFCATLWAIGILE